MTQLDDVAAARPDLIQLRAQLRLSSTAPLSTPTDIDISLHTSPLRVFLERGSLQQLFDVILSNVPALPPSPPPVPTDYRLTPPKRLALTLALGSITIVSFVLIVDCCCCYYYCHCCAIRANT
jgi:hypothetical protein